MDNVEELIVDVKGLTKRYPGTRHPAVDGLSLRIRRGEILGFVGPNGAGKTTTIKMLLNLAWPDSGGGRIFGYDIIRDSVAIRRRIGFMSGEVRLYNSMRGDELLRFLLSLHGGGDKERVRDLIEIFDVPLHRKIKSYSSGQKQMLAMLAALGHKSDLLVLDEPTKGLDPSKKMLFLEQVEKWPEQGGAVLISSHVLSEIEHICTHVGFIREGVMIADEEIEAVRSRLGSVIVATFEDSVEERHLMLAGVRRVIRRGAEFFIETGGEGDGRAVLRALTELPVRSLRYRSATLEDIYEGIYLNEDAGQTDQG
ncbi:MAG TPA: ABC transporter ATP-binding protein [Acidobacteriota bacterium]|nr:ABC transporter ATP-binding protein [Acidobacteriota bacterium]